MMPLNVTHTAIFTQTTHRRLLQPTTQPADSDTSLPLPRAASPLRHTLSTLLTYFAAAYKATFGFDRGPPLHDPLTIAYVSRPDLFKTTRYRVDIELNGEHTSGETVVDMFNYRTCDDSWGVNGKNCLVAESVNVRVIALSLRDIEAESTTGRWVFRLTARLHLAMRRSISSQWQAAAFCTMKTRSGSGRIYWNIQGNSHGTATKLHSMI